jgi:hypothetical protein
MSEVFVEEIGSGGEKINVKIEEKIELKEFKNLKNQTIDFLPLPNVFVCGPALTDEVFPEELFKTYDLKEIQTLMDRDRICLFRSVESSGINFSTEVKELIKPPLKGKIELKLRNQTKVH